MKILDTGTNSGRLNLILVAEGYTENEQGDFRMHADFFARTLQREPWYRPELLNVHAFEIVSNESATALQPQDGPLDTAFNAQLGGGGRITRHMTLNDRRVGEVVGPWWGDGGPYHIGVLVNCRSGGSKATGMFFSHAGTTGWERSALHEFGHSFADLGDEYDYGASRDAYPPEFVEPDYPNVTKDPVGTKWRPITITAYEGAGRHKRGLYRPYRNCRMRANQFPFCAVCEHAIVTKLESYLKDTLPEPEPPGAPAGKISVAMLGRTEEFERNIVGAIAAHQWVLKQLFG